MTLDDKLRQLPVDERIEIVGALWDSIAIDQHALALTPDQKAEIDRRLDAYAVDKDRGRLASEVIDEMRPM